MTYTLHFPEPLHCFVRLPKPMETQATILQMTAWSERIQSKLEEQIERKILMEPRGLFIVLKKPLSTAKIDKVLQKCWKKVTLTSKLSFRRWTFPIYWDTTANSDLMQYFNGDRVAVKQYQEAFVAHPMVASFYGFLPGFVYLGEVSKDLQLPRHSQPRLKVPEGSVAVGERYVGIYPQESPGGWQLLGRTPIKLFDRERKDPFLLRPGDLIWWESIAESTLENGLHATKTYPLYDYGEIYL